MMIIPMPVLALACALSSMLYFLLHRIGVTKRKYPPGPIGNFLTGNLSDIPTRGAPYKYASWKKTYGDLIYLSALGQQILVINSREIAEELLDKRSKNYSSRPHIPVVDMMNWGFMTAVMQSTDRWRLHRRIFQQFLLPRHSYIYQSIQADKIHDMLRGLLATPDKFADHYRNMAGAAIMKIIYDIDITPENYNYVEVAEGAVKNISEAGLPGAMLVNLIPILRHIPAWLPGAQFKRFTDATKILTRKMLNDTFEAAKSNAAGTEPSCVATQLLAKLQDKGPNVAKEEAIRDVCASSFAAGADTTVSTIGTFFYAMTLYEEAQIKAQKEIDRVIGNARLPGYKDRDSLPYVEALCREVMRYHPALPLGLSHYSMNDDIYNGYFIPKGSMILPNIWGMTHDENVYSNPNEFIPKRFLKDDGQLTDDTVELIFGFGRRVCPGRHLGRDTIWLTIATVLAVFDIRKAKDEIGKEIPISVTYSDGFVSHPSAFKCSITPRSDAAKQLIASQHFT